VGEESASGFVCGLYLFPFKILESSLQNRTRDILEQQILQKPTEITEMAKEKWLCLKLGHPPVDHPCSSMKITLFPQSPEPRAPKNDGRTSSILGAQLDGRPC